MIVLKRNRPFLPLGTAFQYRCTGDVPVTFICAALPPWPGDHEAVMIDGPWAPRVDPAAPDADGDVRA